MPHITRACGRASHHKVLVVALHIARCVGLVFSCAGGDTQGRCSVLDEVSGIAAKARCVSCFHDQSSHGKDGRTFMSDKKKSPSEQPLGNAQEGSSGADSSFQFDPSFWEEEAPAAEISRTSPQTPTAPPSSQGILPADLEHQGMGPSQQKPEAGLKNLLHSYLHEVVEQKEAGMSSEQREIMKVLEKRQPLASSDTTRRHKIQPMLTLASSEEGDARKQPLQILRKNPLLWIIPTLVMVSVLLVWALRKPSVDQLLQSRRFTEAMPLLEKEGRWKAMADLYRREGNNRKALEVYVKFNAWLEAAEMLLEQKQYKNAAAFFAKAREWDRAARAYEQAKMYREAAQAFLKIQMKEDAARLFLQVGAEREVVPLLLDLGRKKKAAELYEKWGDWKAAADLYRQLKMWDKAADAAEKAKDYLTAAQLALERKDYPKAASLFAKAAIARCVGVAQSAARQHEQAATVFLLMADHDRSYAMLLRAAAETERFGGIRKGQSILKKALALAEKFEDAAALIRIHGMMGGESRSLRKLQSWIREAQKAGDWGRALEMVQQSLRIADIPMLTRLALQRQEQSISQKREQSLSLKAVRTRFTPLPLPKSPSPQHAAPTAAAPTVAEPTPARKTRPPHPSQKAFLDDDSSTNEPAPDKPLPMLYNLQLSLELHRPSGVSAPKEVQLQCTLFRKDIKALFQAEGDDPEGVDFCEQYRGDIRLLHAFERAPAGHTITQRLAVSSFQSDQPLAISISVPAPYHSIRCALLPVP